MRKRERAIFFLSHAAKTYILLFVSLVYMFKVVHMMKSNICNETTYILSLFLTIIVSQKKAASHLELSGVTKFMYSSNNSSLNRACISCSLVSVCKRNFCRSHFKSCLRKLEADRSQCLCLCCSALVSSEFPRINLFFFCEL